MAKNNNYRRDNTPEVEKENPSVETVEAVEAVEVVPEVTPEAIVEVKPVEVKELTDIYKQLHTVENSDELADIFAQGMLAVKDQGDKLFMAELSDINKYLLVNTNDSINKANLRLNALIINILKTQNKDRFNILNIVFKLDSKRFEPTYLLREIGFTKNVSVITNYAQLITIIEVLADPATRDKKKVSVSNLNNLKLDEVSVTFLKQYYKF